MMEELLNKENSINRFNIRVYGIAINLEGAILLCNEEFMDRKFTKFPGGGMEYGEGTLDCLRREFREELNVEIEIISHFYTTDFFQQSTFVKSDQLISIYYLIKLIDEPINKPAGFFWKPLAALAESDLSFPIDKIIVKMLL